MFNFFLSLACPRRTAIECNIVITPDTRTDRMPILLSKYVSKSRYYVGIARLAETPSTAPNGVHQRPKRCLDEKILAHGR